ncbi:MAG TPA: prepilin-type N-terminal cleavage/methylation domain-containing protein [Gemmatimonadales bacterium]
MSVVRNEQGFTLVSVIIAVVLLCFGLLSLSRAQSLLVVTEHDTGNRGTALALASDYVEQIRTRDPWTLASEPAVQVNARGQIDPNGAFQRSTIVTLDNDNLVRVRVQVTYPRGRLPIEILTLVFRS